MRDVYIAKCGSSLVFDPLFLAIPIHVPPFLTRQSTMRGLHCWVGQQSSIASFVFSFSKKRRNHTRIYLPFWPVKVTWEIYSAECGNSLVLQFFLACHLFMDTKMSLDTQVCFRVPPVYTPCLYPWMAYWKCWNNITSLTLSSVKLSWLCTTIKREANQILLEAPFKSVYCEINEHFFYHSVFPISSDFLPLLLSISCCSCPFLVRS
jgi:hypothetical protein